MAKALRLKGLEALVGEWSRTDSSGFHALTKDGSNLTDPYWRCACEDWLVSGPAQCNLSISEEWVEATAYYDCKRDAQIFTVECKTAEAPARLVSAVWRRMSECP